VVHPAVAAARALGDSLLRPAAERVDVDGVPRSHIEALAAAGLLGVVAPREFGGSDCTLAEMRAVTEQVAAADTSTWFVWTQHHTPVRTLARGTNDDLRRQWIPKLAAGSALAGVAFTHLRRPGRPAVTAERTGDGWSVTGDLAWLTSWGLADVFLVGAQAGDDVVWALVRLQAGPNVQVRPLALAAMQGTATVSVRLEGLPVPHADVVLIEPLAQWREMDVQRTVDVSPAVLGVTAEAIRRLRERADDDAADLADAAERRLAELRGAVDRLVEGANADDVDERLRLRAQSHLLAVDVTAGLVALGGGRSMLLDQPAQRLARVALFLLVQGQTPAVRGATLREISGWRGGI
jgi:alkylation response protein AidB-like acyl-CoA dehydrogenase